MAVAVRRLDFHFSLGKHGFVRLRVFKRVFDDLSDTVHVVGIYFEETEHRRVLALPHEVGEKSLQRVLMDVEYHEIAQFG